MRSIKSYHLLIGLSAAVGALVAMFLRFELDINGIVIGPGEIGAGLGALSGLMVAQWLWPSER